MADEEDPIFSIAEAAVYCGVSRQGVDQCLREAEVPLVEKHKVGGRGPRIVKGVHKSTLDIFRQNGFLLPGKGRGRGGNGLFGVPKGTGRKRKGVKRRNILV